MENIASQLKQARVAMGMTIDEAVSKTKFTLAQINAIESGDLDFFREDLTYFSYMIRYYANVLNYDYELLRQDVEKIVAEDEFTQEIEQIRKNVQVKTKSNQSKTNTKKTKRKRNRKKIDYSFLAFLFSSILLVLVLGYVGIKYVPGWFKEDPVKPPSVVEPNDPDDETNGNEDTPDDVPNDDEDEVEDEPQTQLEVVASPTEPTQLEIYGWEDEEEVEIKLHFKASATWISASVNNTVLDDPLSTTYYEGDEIEVREKASENKEVMFHLGKMLGNEFYVNGEKVELDESIQNNAGVVKLYFKFVKDGEQN